MLRFMDYYYYFFNLTKNIFIKFDYENIRFESLFFFFFFFLLLLEVLLFIDAI